MYAVYVIDEVDRSLHTLLTRCLLEDYLASCGTNNRTQLLLTTHDVLLMDQRWMRRDEMWVTERDNSGASSLLSFSEYPDVRYDKDIRKSYLQGRLGGIPRILHTTAAKKRRSLRRPLGQRRYRKLFVIAAEGEKTEPQYFSLFNNASVIRVLSRAPASDGTHAAIPKRRSRTPMHGSSSIRISGVTHSCNAYTCGHKVLRTTGWL